MNCKESKIWKKIDVFWKAFVKNRSEKHIYLFWFHQSLLDANPFFLKQIYKFEALQPAVVKKKERKPAEARPKKKPRIETEGQPEGVDDGRRKSSRISGKVRKLFRLH